MRRFAATRRWNVTTLDFDSYGPVEVRDAIEKIHPVGIVVEGFWARCGVSPRVFGRVPVVCFDPPEIPAWRKIPCVLCDESAVARLAFQELADTHPSSYVVVSFSEKERWARKRIGAFRDCCRKAGFDCPVLYFLHSRYAGDNASAKDAERIRHMAKWAATLPPHTAVFAVEDHCAQEVARAFAAVSRHIPRSATLVGINGFTKPSPFALPLLEFSVTSVRIDFEYSGYLAAKRLAALASHSATCDGECFGPLFVERRASTFGHGRRDPFVMAAVDAIRREACAGLDACSLHRRFHCSRALFALRFREAIGHTAQDEILRVRLDRVFELLQQPDVPIGYISTSTGFRTRVALEKLFIKRAGVSMRQWRSTHLK